MERIINQLVRFGYSLWIIAVILLLTVGDAVVTGYVDERAFVIPNVIVFLVLLTFMTAGMILAQRQSFFGNRRFMQHLNTDLTARVLVCLLFLIQLFLIWNLFFYSGADSDAIYQAGMSIGRGELPDSSYFSVVPNNLLLATLYGLVFRVVPSAIPILLLHAAENSLACWLVYRCLCFFVSKELSLAGLFVSMLLFGISPWSVMLYSDPIVMLVPVLIFYMYLKLPSCKRAAKILLAAGMILLSVVSYYIKPTCAIVLLAILISECFRKPSVRRLLGVFALTFCLGASFFAVKHVCGRLYEKVGFSIDAEKKLSMPYFLMLGFSAETDGVFNINDFEASKSIETAKERNRWNLETTQERIRQMGPAGLLRHLVRKSLVTYNDGTFAWGVELYFYRHVLPEVSFASRFLRSVFYSYGDLFIWFLQGEQILWIGVLLLMTGACLGGMDERKRVLMISMLGLAVYQILFEARARYLYIMVPLMCILAVLGLAEWYRLFHRVSKKNGIPQNAPLKKETPVQG